MLLRRGHHRKFEVQQHHVLQRPHNERNNYSHPKLSAKTPRAAAAGPGAGGPPYYAAKLSAHAVTVTTVLISAFEAEPRAVAAESVRAELSECSAAAAQAVTVWHRDAQTLGPRTRVDLEVNLKTSTTSSCHCQTECEIRVSTLRQPV